MKWLTLTEIGRRSRSKKGALKVSYEHWNQLYSATAKELREALGERKVFVDYSDCGLCRYYKMLCHDCPLGISDCPCTDNIALYYKADEQLEKWENETKDSNWYAWKRASKALRDKLKELMESEK